MQEPATVCFVGTKELKQALELWAVQEDRSVSAVMRQILEREKLRRAAKENQEAKSNSVV